MPSKLPWFRVQARLIDHPKFINLPPILKGFLLVVWCASYGNSPRGSVPPVRLLGHYFGPGYEWNPSRVRVSLKALCDAGWIDSDGNGGYVLHEWQYWQDRHTTGPLVNDDFQQFSNSSPTDPQQSVDEFVANKATYEKIADVRGKESKSSDSLRSSGVSTRPKKERKKRVESPFFSDVKASLTKSWFEVRSVSISACTNQVDWVQLSRLAQRCESAGVTVATLDGSFRRWLTDSSPWERKQSVAYWCSHWQAFSGANGNSHRQALPVPDDDSYPSESDDRILEL